MTSLTWLHLSDWHQHGKEFDRKEVRDKLLDDIVRCRERFPALQKIDLVFFTGDLAFSGKADEFKTATQELLDPVLEKVERKREHLFLIPGNHDLDRHRLNRIGPDDRKIPKNTQELQKTLESGISRDFALFPFSDYKAWFDSSGAHGGGVFGFGEMLTVYGKKIGIMGCNSALMCGRNLDQNNDVDDYGKLAVGQEQIHDALREIRSADLRIGLIHHPFSWLANFEQQDIEQEMMKFCHFILRGHEHSQRIDIAEGTAGQAVIIRGGACYDGKNPQRQRYANAYNFVSCDLETKSCDVYCRRWDDNKNEWNDDHNKGTEGVYHVKSPVASVSSSERATATMGSEGLLTNERERTKVDLARIQQVYLKYLCNRWENLELRGISRTQKTEALRLEEVYVSLTAEREVLTRPGTVAPIRDKDLPFVAEREDAIPEWENNHTLVIPETNRPLPRTVVEKIELPQALRENRYLVVLGDPGAGKTTLARFLAR